MACSGDRIPPPPEIPTPAGDGRYSPLFPLSSILKIMKPFGGFPLTVRSDDLTTFSFGNHSIWTCLFMPVLYLVSSSVLQLYLVGAKADSAPVLLVVLPNFVPNCVALIVALVLYSRVAADLSRLCQAIMVYRSDCCVPESYHSLAVGNLRWTVLFYALTILCSASSVVFIVQSGRGTISELNLAIISCLSVANVIILVYPALVATSYLITTQLLGAMQILFFKYNGELCYFTQNQRFVYRHFRREFSSSRSTSPQQQSNPDAASRDQDPNSSPVMEEVAESFMRREEKLVNKGFHLHALLDMVEHCWGPFVALECALSLVCQILNTVCVTAFVFRRMNLFLTLAYACGLVQWFLRLQLLLDKGHRIAVETGQVARNLEVVMVNNCEMRCLRSQQRLAMLICRFGRSDPVRPCQAFGLGRANAVVAVGMVAAAALVFCVPFVNAT